MKIAYTHNIFINQRYGGISKYFYNLIKYNLSDNHIKIFSPIYINESIRELGFHNLCGIYNPFNIPKSNRLINLLNGYTNKILIKKWNPKIIHNTYYDGYIFDGVTKILTVYDLIHEKFPQYFAENKILYYKHKSIVNADHVICISNVTKNDLLNIYNVDEKKVSVIHLGFEMQGTHNQKIFNLMLYKPYLIYVGDRRGYKNFLGFIFAFSQSERLIRNFKILVFGGGAFTNDEKLIFHKLKFDSNQIQHINGDDDLLRNLYKSAEALVYPSLYEGFGIPPLEAMSNECPVICSSGGSIPEIVGNAGIYFDPNSVEDMRNKMELTLYSNDLKMELKRNGLNRIKFFSWYKCSNETNKIYESFT